MNNFRRATIRSWKKATIVERVDILTLRGVYLDWDRIISPRDELVELFYGKLHIATCSPRASGVDPQMQAVKTGDTNDGQVLVRVVGQN